MRDTAEAKQRLRAQCAAARRAHSEQARTAARAAIREHVLARCRDAGWQCVAAYVPLRTEPGSLQLLSGLRAAGVRVLVPVTLPDRDLDWAEWSEAGPGGGLGVEAIGAADAVLVPALCVSRDGQRLGRGGGSYDRALPRCAPGVPIAALLFADELVDTVPVDAWDRPVSDVVLPSGWRTLRGNTDVVAGG